METRCQCLHSHAPSRGNIASFCVGYLSVSLSENWPQAFWIFFYLVSFSV